MIYCRTKVYLVLIEVLFQVSGVSGLFSYEFEMRKGHFDNDTCIYNKWRDGAVYTRGKVG